MKTVLITGAARGLGLELCRVFLENGWSVVATGREAKNLPADVARHAHARALGLDVADESSIARVAKTLAGMPIDVLINNAGVYDSSSVDDDAADLSMDQAADVFRTNSLGPKFVSEALLPNLEKGKEKLVVSISSGMGTYGQLFGGATALASRSKTDSYSAAHWAYSASKTALNYAMLSFHVVHPGIKSVLINPGWMKTDIGGADAPLDPRVSAESIFTLISDHAKRLPNGTLVDYQGVVMPF